MFYLKNNVSLDYCESLLYTYIQLQIKIRFKCIRLDVSIKRFYWPICYL